MYMHVCMRQLWYTKWSGISSIFFFGVVLDCKRATRELGFENDASSELLRCELQLERQDRCVTIQHE